MLQEIAKWIEEVMRQLDYSVDLVAGRWRVEHPDDLARGDYATNIAFALSKILKRNPLELAETITGELKKNQPKFIGAIVPVAPGFINFFLTRDFFTGELKQIIEQGNKYGEGVGEPERKVMVEYTDPNPFKEFHLGHLMSNTIGEAISRLIESQGAEVRRACYQGDVGLHVAKAIWGNLKLKTQNEKHKKAKEIKEWSEAYAYGAKAYEGDKVAEQEIDEINKKIYGRSDPAINVLYEAGRELSLDYFEKIYRRLGTKFDYYFFESESGPVGQKLVEEHLDAKLPFGSLASSIPIFEKSDEAVVFKGERYNLHTRVFINSEDLPTYETKELGLAKLKFERYPYDESVVITGNEVVSYFAVVKKVLELIFPDLARRTKHLPHGMLRLPSGKMSSRTGTAITAENFLAEIKTVIGEKIKKRDFNPVERETITEAVAVGAIKYSILKQSPGRDIIFDLTKSLSFDGDSGPYLQYSYVRARAVLEKGLAENISINFEQPPAEISELERRFTRFPEVVARAVFLYAPNLLVTYLTELASSFNTYYAAQKIIDPTDLHSPYRLALTATLAHIMRSGLNLLGIPVLEKM